MILREVYDFLNEISPFDLQEAWDNSGMIVGAMDRAVSQIVVSLEVDAQMIDAAEEGALFVVHHPLIFGKLAQLDFATYPANLIERLIQKKQSLIAMHTNFDQTHLNRYVFEKVLGFEIASQQPFVCQAEGEWSYEELIDRIQTAFALPFVRVVHPKETIRSVALTTGSGASLIDTITAECFLTGDIKYHDAIKAQAQGLMMVEIGHYESERFFGEVMGDVLKTLPVLAIITPPKNPFRI